jgi:deazaflavin-dependent oxidoreductase (nitroreductase family)
MSGDRKRRLVVAFEKYLQTPPVKAALRAGLPLPMFALLETTGRTSGRRRHTPVINGRHGGRFWIVAEHGRRAQYVRNLEADPNVRVKSGGRWYAGRAHILDDDDPLVRARWMADTPGPWHKADSFAARLLGTQPLTIRIYLEPTGTGQPAKPCPGRRSRPWLRPNRYKGTA